MPRSGRVLDVVLKCLALLAAVAAIGFAAGFVAPPAAGPHVSHFRGSALNSEALPLEPPAPPSAQAPESSTAQVPSFLKWVSAGAAAGLILAVLAGSTEPAEAVPNARVKFTPENFTVKKAKHLELCKDNKKYHKKIKDQIYKIQQRQKKYPAGSVVFNRYATKIQGVKRREEAYGDRYCGKKDGLPRAIATGELVRGNVVIPALMFLYTAGWIGWAGRSYLVRTQDEMKELNIDVPLALTCMASGFAWPVAAWGEYTAGTLTAKDDEIHQSGLASF